MTPGRVYMKKRKIISVGAALLLSAGLLAGCGKTGATPVTDTKTTPEMEQIAIEEQVKPENKTYAPYEHVIFKRYILNNAYVEEIYGGQVIIPEGYEILEIESVTKKSGYGSRTAGFDVWFINTKPVEAEAVYNQSFEYYDYSEPGKVIELELQEESPTLTKTR